jgi:hypothetical protein
VGVGCLREGAHAGSPLSYARRSRALRRNNGSSADTRSKSQRPPLPAHIQAPVGHTPPRSPAREGNVVRVDFRRTPDPPSPCFPGANGLRLSWAEHEGSDSSVSLTVRPSRVRNATTFSARRLNCAHGHPNRRGVRPRASPANGRTSKGPPATGEEDRWPSPSVVLSPFRAGCRIGRCRIRCRW